MSENYDHMKEQVKELQELCVQDGFKCDEYLKRIAELERGNDDDECV